MNYKKGNFDKRNRVKNQVKRGIRKALQEGKIYGKGHSAFHLPKSEIHGHSHPNRYTKISNTNWLKTK